MYSLPIAMEVCVSTQEIPKTNISKPKSQNTPFSSYSKIVPVVKQEQNKFSSPNGESCTKFETKLIKCEGFVKHEDPDVPNLNAQKLPEGGLFENETTVYNCNICSEGFKVFVEYRAHRKQHFINKRTCKVCQTVCQSISKLEIHMNTHLGLKPYKCMECGKNFVSNNQLKLHERSHSDEKRYSCQKCTKAFRHLGSLRSHMVTHNNIKEFQCKNCSEVCTNVQSYRKHLESHGQRIEIKCELCDKIFPTDRHLQSHLNSHAELQYPCEYCERIYPSLYRLKRHIKRAHIPNVCEECDAIFYDRAMYTKHRKQHNEGKPTACSHCGKTFDKQKNLSEHVRLQHREDGNIHKCDLCDKTFINGPLLRNHIKTHDKCFRCKYCNKLFSSRYNLETHSVTHTGEKNHKCDVCGKGYSTKSSLKNHKATHSDVKNFKCDQCPKLFKTNRRLYVHKFSHATEEKFQCEICNARFRVKQYLKYHMIKHSSMKPYECKVCKKKFKHKKSWEKHSTHDKHLINLKNELYHCDLCPELCGTKTDLLEHVRLLHEYNTKIVNLEGIGQSPRERDDEIYFK